MHHRGTGRARQALLRWSHLVWPLAVVLSLPLLLPLQPPAAAVPSPTLLPHCISLSVEEWVVRRRWMVAGVLLVTSAPRASRRMHSAGFLTRRVCVYV